MNFIKWYYHKYVEEKLNDFINIYYRLIGKKYEQYEYEFIGFGEFCAITLLFIPFVFFAIAVIFIVFFAALSLLFQNFNETPIFPFVLLVILNIIISSYLIIARSYYFFKRLIQKYKNEINKIKEDE